MSSSNILNVTTSLIPDTINNLNVIDIFQQVGGVLYDFHKLVAADWDEVLDGEKLTRRGYTTWNALNIIRLTLSAWILGSHMAIITFILTKKVLRNQPKNLLIVNVALVNMIMGVFVIPVKLHFTLNPNNMQCNLAVGWTFITDYYQPSVSLFAVLSLVLERFLYVYTEKKQKNVKPLVEKIGTAVLMISAWILSCIYLLPIFFGGLLAKSTNPEQCVYKVDDRYFLAAQLLSFVLPSLGVFILAPFTGLLDCLRPKRCFYRPLTPKENP
uniref:G-protein coupled receptors family 1 profile domain-containing protein n=1 Tax=Arion vulgaris TaxID=1028688 RepID=A0A0B7ADB5_9EUPU